MTDSPRLFRTVEFALPVPPVKQEYPAGGRACEVDRRTVLTASAPWPLEFRRGYRFRGAYKHTETVPYGGRVVIAGTIVGRSRDGLRITVAQ